VISASDDQTLKVWDLASGHELAILQGHADFVNACAVTPDGRRAVSASEDQTVKVWDLESGTCLLTHHGNTAFSAITATTSVVIAGDVTGAVWFLDGLSPDRREPPIYDTQRPDNARTSSPGTEPPPSRLPIKHTILFLAANPIETAQLALDREARAIQVELERSGFRDRFELVTRWAVEPLDLLRELRKLKPTVIHFSGHGSQAAAGLHHPGPARAPYRDVVGGLEGPGSEHPHGLFFQDADGRRQFVSARAIEETFGAAGSSVQLVVLNACYSELQADALLTHVDCVVGMSGATRDDAARSFAIGFYGALGDRESIAAAYKHGRAAISLEGQHDSDRPQLKARVGVDPSRLVLAADPPRPRPSRAPRPPAR